MPMVFGNGPNCEFCPSSTPTRSRGWVFKPQRADQLGRGTRYRRTGSEFRPAMLAIATVECTRPSAATLMLVPPPVSVITTLLSGM